jgi:hypothetical protein
LRWLWRSLGGTFTLCTCLCYIITSKWAPFGGHTMPQTYCFEQSLTLEHVGKYVWITRAFTPMASTLASIETTFHTSYSWLTNQDYLMEFQPNTNLDLSFDFLRYAFIFMSHLLTNGPFGMVVENLWNSFDSKYSINNFSSYFWCVFL